MPHTSSCSGALPRLAREVELKKLCERTATLLDLEDLKRQGWTVPDHERLEAYVFDHYSRFMTRREIMAYKVMILGQEGGEAGGRRCWSVGERNGAPGCAGQGYA